MSDIIRGCTDTIILSRLAEKDSYGYEIIKTVQELTDGKLELKEGTLYTTFRRLESLGQIVSYWGDETTGARRRYYGITDEGKRNYEENLADWESAKEMLDKLLKKGDTE